MKDEKEELVLLLGYVLGALHAMQKQEMHLKDSINELHFIVSSRLEKLIYKTSD
jgi:hypothetical protein